MKTNLILIQMLKQLWEKSLSVLVLNESFFSASFLGFRDPKLEEGVEKIQIDTRLSLEISYHFGINIPNLCERVDLRRGISKIFIVRKFHEFSKAFKKIYIDFNIPILCERVLSI